MNMCMPQMVLRFRSRRCEANMHIPSNTQRGYSNSTANDAVDCVSSNLGGTYCTNIGKASQIFLLHW